MTEKENHLPNLSSEERAHALELAMQARRRYAALKARVKSGELTFTDAMDEEDGGITWRSRCRFRPVPTTPGTTRI